MTYEPNPLVSGIRVGSLCWELQGIGTILQPGFVLFAWSACTSCFQIRDWLASLGCLCLGLG